MSALARQPGAARSDDAPHTTAAEPIRVALDAHVVGRRQTGNETYVVNLAEALAARSDVRATVFLDAGTPWPSAAPVVTEALRLRTPYLRLPFELPMRARRGGAQLLHVQYVSPPLPRLPVVTTIHDISFEDLPNAFPRATELRLKASIRLAARRSAAVIASSSYTRERLIDRYRLRPERVHVALLGVHPRWSPAPPDAPTPEGLTLPGRFVLAVGNVHPRKNLPRLVHAVDRARRMGADDLGLVVVGRRLWQAADLDRAIREVRGESWTHLPGYVPDEALRVLYSRATVVAYPSLYEGFGLPVLEAMACGAAVVASSATSIPEVAGDGAILIDPLDTDGLAAALLLVASDSATRMGLRAAALRRAADFSWDRCAAETVSAYRAALAR
jgi:glycosyltransferase involved in cell wall biosynthesis